MWQFQDKEFKPTDIPDNAIGFIYEMTAVVDGKAVRYIGKKDFYSNTKKNMGKREIAALTDKRVKKYTQLCTILKVMGVCHGMKLETDTKVS